MVLFFSESEVDNKKFQKSTKYFEKFKNASDVKNSGLPILNVFDEINGFTVIEFDLSRKNEIKKIMGIKDFVSVPLIYIFLNKHQLYGVMPSYRIIQNVAAKYMSMKLLCCSTNQFANQLDMFPCVLKGLNLDFA